MGASDERFGAWVKEDGEKEIFVHGLFLTGNKIRYDTIRYDTIRYDSYGTIGLTLTARVSTLAGLRISHGCAFFAEQIPSPQVQKQGGQHRQFASLSLDAHSPHLPNFGTFDDRDERGDTQQ